MFRSSPHHTQCSSRLTLIEPATGSRFNIGDWLPLINIQDEEDPASTIPMTITSSADSK